MSLAVRDEGRSFQEGASSVRFAAAVAAFGMLLRESKHSGRASWAMVRG